jgi:hypothetical protein
MRPFEIRKAPVLWGRWCLALRAHAMRPYKNPSPTDPPLSLMPPGSTGFQPASSCLKKASHIVPAYTRESLPDLVGSGRLADHQLNQDTTLSGRRDTL